MRANHERKGGETQKKEEDPENSGNTPLLGLRESELKVFDVGIQKKIVFRIDIFCAWCKACGICVAFCPTGVLEKDEAGYPYVKDIEKCINCGWCEIRCPDFAITVKKKGEGNKKKVGEKGEEAESERVLTAGQ